MYAARIGKTINAYVADLGIHGRIILPKTTKSKGKVVPVLN